jgi:sugar phosphate isomerase/epimerase
MTTFSRREMLAAPVVLAATTAVATAATDKKMTLAMHQNTSNGAGYRKSPEGWARAGIRDVEITNVLLDVRTSPFISTLPTILKITRAAAHPNVAPMLDCYHYWSGLSKLEDLDLIHPGEIGHVHFQDVPDIPREMLDLTTRIIPGDGVSPLTRILGKLSEKGYAGPLSVELFLPRFQQGDPYEVAREIRVKSEAVMREAPPPV